MCAFCCVCCLDGRIASRDADKVRSRRYRRNRRADRKAGGGKTSGRSLNTGGGIKRANSQRASLFLPLTASFFLLSFLPFPFCRLPLRTSHPIRFSSFHFYMDFFSRARPFFLSFVESLAQTCCPPHFSSLSQPLSFFSLYFFFPS